MSTVGRLLSIFHANYKDMYNLCDEFIRCLDGALLSSEVNTLNSSCSDPHKSVDRGATVDIYQIKHRGLRLLFYITSDKINLQISVGSGESCELTPGRLGFKSG